MVEIYEGTILFEGERGYHIKARRFFLDDGYLLIGTFTTLTGTSHYTVKIRLVKDKLFGSYKCVSPAGDLESVISVHTLDFLKDGVLITGVWPESGEMFDFKADLPLIATETEEG